MKKGISLIVLTVTIVVLAILTGIAIYYVDKNNILTESSNTITGYNDRVINEQIEILEVDYAKYYKKNISSETKTELANKVKTLKLKAEAFTVFYNSNSQTEYILYRYDKTTEDERAILEAAGVNMLKGDANLDGFLSTEDVIAINNHAAGSSVLTNEQFEVADITDDGVVNVFDATAINQIFAGTYSYQGGAV